MAFIKLTNSTTADADEVMGDLYYIGAGDRPPYFQTTAGGLSEIDNTYDLGSDTAGWRRLYAHNIGDSTYSYDIRGGTVTAEINNITFTDTAIAINSTCSMSVDCTATMQQIYNPEGIKHKSGPIIKTLIASIGAWAMQSTAGSFYDISWLITTTMSLIGATVYIIPNANILSGATTGSSLQQGGFLHGPSGWVYVVYRTGSGAPTFPSIDMTRIGGGVYDRADFNDASDNRGYITIKYFEA